MTLRLPPLTHTILTGLLLLLAGPLLGQNNDFMLSKTKHPDKEKSFQRRLEFLGKIGLDTVHLTQHPWYFRLSTQRKIISIWQNSKGVVSGSFVIWVWEAVSDEPPTNRIYHETYSIPPQSASKILSMVTKSGIEYLPDQSEIPKWRTSLLHGVSFSIEIANDTSYSYKSYWNPGAQDSLYEAIIFTNLIDSLLSICNSEVLISGFNSRIPFESYFGDGTWIVLRFLPRNQRWRYRRERKKYRRAHGLEP